MKIFFAALACLMIFSLGAQADNAIDPQKSSDFWKWFASHSIEYEQIFSWKDNMSDADHAHIQKTFEDIVVHLKEVNPKIVPFVEASENTPVLTISARGESQYFPIVDDFVRTAPTIPGWKIASLKAPVKYDADSEIKTGNATIKIGDLRYSSTGSGPKRVAIILYFPFAVDMQQENADNLARSLVEDALGERLSATLIGTVTAKQLPSGSTSELKPFVHIHDDMATN
jgi:hypothetical protein